MDPDPISWTGCSQDVNFYVRIRRIRGSGICNRSFNVRACFFNCSGLGADPDPKFPIQKVQEKHEKLGRGGRYIFFLGGRGYGIFKFCLVYFVFCFVITIAIQPLTENEFNA